MSSSLPLSAEDVAEIVAILDGSDYQTLDIKTSRFRLRVARDGDGWAQEWDWSDETASQAGLAPPPPDAAAGENADAKAICAPLPGTFYRAPQPGAPPFVAAGDSVTTETVIGIIETMKLMNPVHAGRDGIIGEILAENGAMVAKGETLMRLT
jgi:acetyl-CoA carboxylase biotin carboxyl carrier protein